MQRNVRKIEPPAPILPMKKRVAAYARVSSGKDAMLHSLSAQISYYSEFIQKHCGWEYAGVYADEAMTGTKDIRKEFQRLLTDCRNGKIDMVITKSISRFARNTVTMLETVRELKFLNIDVFFEKENIHTMSGDGELILTILSSYAEAESFSVSENCKWRIRNKFHDGIPNGTTILGYSLNGETFEIVPEEAEIVRMIFSDYLNGMGRNAIARKLTKAGIQTKRGNSSWNDSSIRRILTNEKYAGDMLLQKTYVSDHISKKRLINTGILPKYSVKDSHGAIIDMDTFQKVQSELQKRGDRDFPSKKAPENNIFDGKIVCDLCGKNYQRKINNIGSKYAKPVWICKTFNMRGKNECPSQQIPEEILISLTSNILKIKEFNEAEFKKKIKEIHVPGPFTLEFILFNGESIIRHWQNKPRSEGWSEEVRQRARERKLKVIKGGKTQCQQQDQ